MHSSSSVIDLQHIRGVPVPSAVDITVKDLPVYEENGHKNVYYMRPVF